MYKLVVIACVLMAAVAQMMLKKGATLQHSSLIREYLNPWVMGGYMLMGLSMMGNIFAMSNGVQVKEVSIMESFSYLFVPLLSWLIFGEHFTRRKMLAIAIIMLGVFIFFI